MKHGESESMQAPFLRRSARRIPLHVAVTARPALRNAWSRNISATGMALIAIKGTAREPKRGEKVSLDFSFRDSDDRIQATGLIQWIHPVPDAMRADSYALGVSFLEMEAPHREAVLRYISGYRPNVALLHAGTEEESLCRSALADAVNLHVVRDEFALPPLLARGDISSCVILGEAAHALASAETIAGPRSAGVKAPEISRFEDPRPHVVLCTSAPPESLLRLHNQGKVFRSLSPPLNATELRAAVQEACSEHALRVEMGRISLELGRPSGEEESWARTSFSETSPPEDLVSESRVMKEVMELVYAVATYPVPVLLTGETGTGKELLSRVVHQLSERAAGPFVALDCGALTETLLESELFGHVKGAFTGATSDHPGLFRLAHGGTILLDEIENMTPTLQAKLLRVLETSQIRPVGGTKLVAVDARLIAASNRDLPKEVAAGRFRSDLFYRLNRFPIDVPPLRQRQADVVPLARRFLDASGLSLARPTPGFTPEAEMALLAHDWPGNVRELRNAVERALLLTAPGDRVGTRGLVPVIPADAGMATRLASASAGLGAGAEGAPLGEQVDGFERELIRSALERNRGILRRAAAELGLNPVTLGRRARSLGLWPPPDEGPEDRKRRAARKTPRTKRKLG